MNNTVIKVENLSKQYRLGEVGTGSLKDDFKRFRYKLMGKEDPFLLIGDSNDRTTKSKSDYVWALHDINFEIEKGDVVGVIGRNGAGKSTLLKILSRTTGPTIGTVKMKGRIASLLEVGTGFHPDLSGRENIYLNGAILGLRKFEIEKKFDEIVSFAGVDKYIDTPVKRYSSGMYVRLAFAVAAYLEPDILIVDEVLAVGDAEFQKKCLGKIKDVSTNDGRTVLFVSHNMNSIQNLCTNCMVMEKGKMVQYGGVSEVLNSYLTNQGSDIKNEWVGSMVSYDHAIELRKISVFNSNDYRNLNFTIKDSLVLEMNFLCHTKSHGIAFEVLVKDFNQVIVFSSFTDVQIIEKGEYKVSCNFPPNLLNDISYSISFGVSKNYLEFILKKDDIISFAINEGFKGEGYQGEITGIVRPNLKWQVTKQI